MTDWLTEPGDTIIAIIRQIAREEALRVLVEHNRGLTDADARAAAESVRRALEPLEAAVKAEGRKTCGASDPNRPQAVCLKPPHKGRHKYTVQAAPPPPRNWEPVQEAQITSGTRTYTITKGHPVKVKGLGRAGAVGDGYKVVSMERHTENGEVNVEVVKAGRNQRSRVVKLDRIVYKRPKK